MNIDLFEAIRTNLLAPPVLFFALGMTAALVKSDLKFPEALYTAMTIFLLVAIGFKGGVSIQEAGIGAVWLPALAAVALGAMIPLWTYPILRFVGRLPAVDAASIAAHYGSVSAVTFTVAINFLKDANQPYEPYAAAFLAVMESPAIIVGILLGKLVTRNKGSLGTSMKHTLHEAIFGRSVLLLMGSLVIGFLCGKKGMDATSGFFLAPFQGILALFLLELGTVAGRRVADLKRVGLFLLGFGVVMPIVHGTIGLLLGLSVGLSLGGATLLAVLASSASYIAAPAAMRLSLPDANPTLSLTSALAITFPFNVTIGIPLYFAIGQWWLGGH